MRRVLGSAGVLALVTVTVGLAQRPPSGSGDAAEGRRPFPAFDLPVPDGGRVTLEAYRGRLLLVNFWASWCGPCRTEMPALDALRTEVAGPDFAFLALNADIDRRHATRFLERNKLDVPIAFGGPRLQRTYLLPGLPYTVLVDREGYMIKQWIGQLSKSSFTDIRAAIAAERSRHDPAGLGARYSPPVAGPPTPAGAPPS